jgi:hypothetical protein
MPRLTFRVVPGGPPVVDVTLEPSDSLKQWLAQNGSRPAIPVNMAMLVDTGSDVTQVTGERVAMWGVPPGGGHKLRTVAGVVKVPAIELDIVFFDTRGQKAMSIDRVLVGAPSKRPWAGRPYQGVIGRDVLDRLLLFTYGGSQRACSVDY